MLTTTQYRVDAIPFENEAAARFAIMKYNDDEPGGSCTIRHYSAGYYVLIQFANGGTRWLTQESEPRP